MANTQKLADRAHTDPKKFRRFLRDDGKGVGQGQRYDLPADRESITDLLRRYREWDKQHSRRAG